MMYIFSNFYLKTIKIFGMALLFVFLSFGAYASEDESKSSEVSLGDGFQEPPKKKRLAVGLHAEENPLITEDEDILIHEKQKGIMPFVDVVRIFLMLDKKAKQIDPSLPPMDKLKINKLCYYAQGYFLAFFDRPLFDEPTYAFEYGPYYDAPIKAAYKECTVGDKHSLELKTDIELAPYDPETVKFVEQIYNFKKKFTGLELKDQTHLEDPWDYNGTPHTISKSVLKRFFSKAGQISPFLRKIFEGSDINQAITHIFGIKQLLRQTRDIKEVITFNDHLSGVIASRPLTAEELGPLSAAIAELVDWNQESVRAVASYLFFPAELIEEHTSLPTLFLDFPLHWKLAYSARYGHPVAQLFFAKLLAHFGVFDDKKDQFLERANNQFKRISVDATMSPYSQGLAFKYLDQETEAQLRFQAGNELGHPPSSYELAKIMDRKGEAGVFEMYKRSFDGGYILAALGMGYYSAADEIRFQNFKRLGDSGVGEGYYQIGKMIKEGCVVPGSGPIGSRSWFLMAVEAGSVEALLNLAKDYEEESNDVEAARYYKALSKTGNLSGFLEYGRILENNELYNKAIEIYGKAGWMGLLEIARLEPSMEEEKKAQARLQLEKHFRDLIDIAEGKDEDEE